MTPDLTQNQALNLWLGVLGHVVRNDGADLSARQMVILLTVYMRTGAHTVRGLAAGLGISKPAVTRALDRLADLGYVRRAKDTSDRRSVLVRRTIKGSVYLNDFAGVIAAAARDLEA